MPAGHILFCGKKSMQKCPENTRRQIMFSFCDRNNLSFNLTASLDKNLLSRLTTLLSRSLKPFNAFYLLGPLCIFNDEAKVFNEISSPRRATVAHPSKIQPTRSGSLS
jgi:hypothetical protein